MRLHSVMLGALAAVLGVVNPGPKAPRATAAPPNLVLIMADDK